MKYYAVKKGKNPGIYESWNEAKKQVIGFKGAIYKSFETKEEAENFMSKEKEELDSIDIDKINTFAFVDGSFNKKELIYGSGYFLYHRTENSYEYTESSFSGNKKELLKIANVAGEILAAEAAIEEAFIHRKYKEVYIFFDYQGVQSWADESWDCNNMETLKYSQSIKSLSEIGKIHFIKVKSHSNQIMNDYVDLLAKKACNIEIDNDKFIETKNTLFKRLNMEVEV